MNRSGLAVCEETLDNSGAVCTVSGYELLNNGIRIQIPASLSSELLLFEAID